MSTLTTSLKSDIDRLWTEKSDIDRLWTEFWTGGITNPLTVIEQISFLMFSRLLDVTETRTEKREARTKKMGKHIFTAAQQALRWSHFKHLPAEEMLRVVRDKVFPHFRDLNGGTTFSEYMKDAQLMVTRPSLLVNAVNMIDRLPITDGDAKGDLYEYMLGKLTTAGINGQFRTPRHIIRFMVELLEPKPTETVGDPACGTAGFLVGTMQYLLETHTSAKGKLKGEHGETIYTGDLLEPYRAHIQSGMFHGFDFDATMLRIASMNLMLHGVDNPDIHNRDTLSNAFMEKSPKQAEGSFDVILANPPFKGSLDEGDVHPSLTQQVKTKKTELLFIALILRMLKKGGRSATIVPDGVLFGSSKAHVALRRLLVEQNQLEAVISLPSGVFKPYAGVSTAILVFSKGGKTDHVFFCDVQSDGFSLDDKRTASGPDIGPLGPKNDNDLYPAVERWRGRSAKQDTDRTAQHFMVSRADILAQDFDLSINHYKESRQEEIEHEAPEAIIARLESMESAISRDLKGLRDVISTFFDMFGDPVNSPKRFDVFPLGSLADVAAGVAKGKRYEGQTTVSIPYMRVANVQDGHLSLAEVKSIEVSKDEAVRYRLQIGDVLLPEGGDPDKLGRGAVWNGEIDPCIHQNHIFRVRTKEGLDPNFLSAQLGSARGKRYFLRAAKQTTGIASINLGQLRDFPVVVPPFSLQAAYVRAHELIFSLRKRLRDAAGTTDDLSGSLVRHAFCSEVNA